MKTGRLRNNGGPAFPVSPGNSDHGMSLRDYFAAAALAGLLHDGLEAYKPPAAALLAEEAYEIADALLAAREAK
jgi:hypothetical protein